VLYLEITVKTCQRSSRFPAAVNSGDSSKGSHALARAPRAVQRFEDDSSQLVYTSISQHNSIESIQVFPLSLKVIRQKLSNSSNNVPPVRTEIQGFSEGSRRRLRFLAGNPCQPLISQFGMTYHNAKPDGRTAKKHINSFLTRLRYRFPETHYIWIAEFQSRGVLHFHLYLSLPYDLPGLRGTLAAIWHKIAEPDSDDHLMWHKRKDNFIAWDMSNPSYLCKYLDKASQKSIPEGFTGMGRFWGNSRNLLAIPTEINRADLEHLVCDEVDQATGEIVTADPFQRIIRTIGKLHESQIKRWQKKTDKKLWKSRVRTGSTSYTLQTAAPQVRQLLAYLRKQYEDESDKPF
jgi:hypothetical protein